MSKYALRCTLSGRFIQPGETVTFYSGYTITFDYVMSEEFFAGHDYSHDYYEGCVQTPAPPTAG
jgi:hypothetical protein